MFIKATKQALRHGLHVYLSKKTISPLLTAILIVSLLIPFQQTPVYATGTPELSYPPDFSTVTVNGEGGSEIAPPQALPVFSWKEVDGATMYRIQFTQDINFTATNIKLEKTTTHTQYTPESVGVFNDGIWYWRVRVEAPAPIGNYSEHYTFTKRWASSQNLPELLAPADNEVVSFFDPPAFSWTPVIGAGTYKIQLSLTSDFITTVLNVDTLNTTYQPKELIANGNYYWRVVPIDPSGTHLGTASAPRFIRISYDQVPVLLEPANRSTPTFTPTFRWTAVRGAAEYHLQYSTDPTFGGIVTNISTKNTTYTPVNALENDKNYYWRVQAYNGISYSKYSNQDDPTPWYFVKRWYIKPVLLTPITTFQYVRIPFFSWTPVPGAAKYKIELSFYSDFRSTISSTTVQNTFYTSQSYDWTNAIRYWRVTPYDGANNAGKPSDVGQFTSYEFNYSPDLVYPQYYYPPNTFPAPDQAVTMNPYEDRSIAYPLFSWHRLFDPSTGEIFAKAYRINVGTGMNPDGTISGVFWTTDTENLYAAPKAGEPFNTNAGTDYYWQVIPLDGLNGNQIGQFSQAWKTRFDPAKAPPATAAGSAPKQLRPVYTSNYNAAIFPGYDSSEFVEITPAFEWFPVSGASSYHIQISRSSDFSSLVEEATVTNPVYAPRTGFAQRNLNQLNFGSYYWRVQVLGGSWSETWRFEIAAQSQWRTSRTIGDATNRLEIARDPAGDAATNDYDLTGLYAVQEKDYWNFGFNYSGIGTSTYVLYMDVDNRESSGATAPLHNNTSVAFNNAHRPEYAIEFTKSAGAFNATQVIIYHWANSVWDSGLSLSYIGGQLYTEANYAEIRVPYAPIGMQPETGSYSLALVSVNGTNQAADTVPQNTITSGTASLNLITTVSEHMTLTTPTSDLTGDPATFPSIPPFFWNASAGAPWAGYMVKVYLDSQFTTLVTSATMTATGPYYSSPSEAWGEDFLGDNTYYWRVMPQYTNANGPYGSWSQALRFERSGFVPQNLQVSVTQATPTFSWDRVEGAKQYKLRIDTDPNFTHATDYTTTEPNYTNTVAMAEANYYWKVLVIRDNNEVSAWTPTQTFTLALPLPTGLTPDASATVDHAPTLCWDILTVYKNGTPVLFPWKYRVQISKGDPEFSSSSIMESVDTLQNCWTPSMAYDDWQYYWHVAMIDGSGHPGAYSARASFTKQYPVVRPKLPASGSKLQTTPIFTWTAADDNTPYVFGAASYIINISKVANFSTSYEKATTVETTYTPTRNFDANTTYYWQVAIVDAKGKIGPYTNALLVIGNYKTYTPIILK
jgi:hypothetical protein